MQDFLERFEVGETVGAGGTHHKKGSLLLNSGAYRPLQPGSGPCAGFAVVKRGRDKLTGEPVAIKVHDGILLVSVFSALHWAGMQSCLSDIPLVCRLWISQDMQLVTTV